MKRGETVTVKLMHDLARSLDAEARGVLGPGFEQCSPQGRRYRQMHARCFRACADRIRQTLATGKVPDGLH